MIRSTLLLIPVLTACTAFAQYNTKQEKGYFNITTPVEIQVMSSIDSTMLANGTARMKSGFEVNTINGYFINPSFSIGLGIGVQFSNYKYYPYPGHENDNIKKSGPGIVSLPLFADFRYYPRDAVSTPLFIIDAGYAPVLSTRNKDDRQFLDGGALFKIGAGYKLYISDLFSFVPSINFKAQLYGNHTAVGGVLSLGLLF
ncbi:hypothetical protein A8C56_15480 [Niabella ginsenosidivorans]|uniref:Outer membrane protein beta-barrel domain-containing protein n=1 Tax=Niabella ginsenosidivorans TaxID=1176587 RepID=A0A1A9IB74_9BACT|nr:hypothetical protein A8C56_15480 [Niabella ginsenosidivorans]